MYIKTKPLAAIIMTSCGILLGTVTHSLYVLYPVIPAIETERTYDSIETPATVSNAETEEYIAKMIEPAVISEPVGTEQEREMNGEQQGKGTGAGESIEESKDKNTGETAEGKNVINDIQSSDAKAPLMEEGVEMEIEADSEEKATQHFMAEGTDPASSGTPSNALPDNTVSEDNSTDEALSYTEEDLYILAHVICGEAQCYPDDEQRYVGSVVLNRVANNRYPSTIKDVVFQKGQYACTWDGNYYREPTEANWENAKWLLENGSVLPVNVVYQSRGKQGSGVYLQTKYHKYCY